MTPIYDHREMPPCRLLYSRSRIESAIDELAGRISAEYAGREIVLVVVLKGAFIFAADLARKLTVPLTFDFVRISSYSGTETTGEPSLDLDLQSDVRGRHVLVVEDIVDTGITLSYLLKRLQERAPASLEVCTLIDKKGRRRTEIDARYAGISCEGGFLVGYGLDLDGWWRELPAIYEVEETSSRRAE